MHIHIILRSTAKHLGLKRYFTALPCPKGHICERLVSNHGCIQCRKDESCSEKGKAYNKAYRGEHKERLASYHVAYRSTRRDIASARSCLWAKENHELSAQHSRNRRARLCTAEGSHTAFDISRIIKAQKNKCANCVKSLNKRGGSVFHVDHICPLSKGGSNWPSNLQILCPGCNLRKHAKDPLDWAQENGRLL